MTERYTSRQRLIAEARTYAKNVRARAARSPERIAILIEELADALELQAVEERATLESILRVGGEPVDSMLSMIDQLRGRGETMMYVANRRLESIGEESGNDVG